MLPSIFNYYCWWWWSYNIRTAECVCTPHYISHNKYCTTSYISCFVRTTYCIQYPDYRRSTVGAKRTLYSLVAINIKSIRVSSLPDIIWQYQFTLGGTGLGCTRLPRDCAFQGCTRSNCTIIGRGGQLKPVLDSRTTVVPHFADVLQHFVIGEYAAPGGET